MLSHLLPLPKTAHELLLDPSDTNPDTSSESESSGVQGHGGTVRHRLAGDLFVTGRAKRSNQGRNGDYGGLGRGSEGDRPSSYRGNWRGGTGRDSWEQNDYRQGHSLSHSQRNMGPIQGDHGRQTALLAILLHGCNLILS